MGFSGVIILKARKRIKMGFSGVIILKARSRSRWGSVELSS